MKLRKFVYRFMSVEFLTKRIALNSKIIETSNDSKEVMKAIDEEFDILEAILFKQRHNREFCDMVCKDLQGIVDKYKTRG